MAAADYEGPPPQPWPYSQMSKYRAMWILMSEIVMLHWAGRYKEKLISSLPDEEADNRERYYYMIDSIWSNSPWPCGLDPGRGPGQWLEGSSAVLGDPPF